MPPTLFAGAWLALQQDACGSDLFIVRLSRKHLQYALVPLPQLSEVREFRVSLFFLSAVHLLRTYLECVALVTIAAFLHDRGAGSRSFKYVRSPQPFMAAGQLRDALPAPARLVSDAG